MKAHIIALLFVSPTDTLPHLLLPLIVSAFPGVKSQAVHTASTMIIMPGAAAAPVPSYNPAGLMETLASPVAALNVGENKALWVRLR